MTHYLALDWGGKKIGVALADSETKIAFAHDIITNDDQFLDMLNRIIAEYNVADIIVGTPQHDQFEQNKELIEKFIEKIERETEKVVLSVNEVFSTQSAQANLRAAGKKTDDDAEAARIILQNWLDTKVA